MFTLRCCVVDDEPLAGQLIASYIEKTPFLELAGVFTSAQEAIKTIFEKQIDVVFLDIQMPQLNGIEFAKIIPQTCRIILTTAYDFYAIQGFKVNALDYLLKPINYEEFIESANKALKWAELNNQVFNNSSSKDFIIVKSEYKLIQIPISDILFVEGLKDYVKIYIDNEQKSIMTLMSMKTLERHLPMPQFLRVHRSFIVNTCKIKTIERNRIIFGNHYIPVSESYKQAFAEYINKYSLSASIKDNSNEM